MAAAPPDDRELRGEPIAVLGLGIEGRDIGRFLLERGARVAVFDTRPRGDVAEAAAEMESLGATVHLGPVSAATVDGYAALYVSQSVLLHRDPLVARMRVLGRPVRTMLAEFLRRWPGPIAGITGSSGKTTTTALVDAAFTAAGVPHILGGNIGRPLLAQLPAAVKARWAVLEISHTQLQHTGRSPNIAAVTNVTPNHLDQFSWDQYVELKRSLLRYQSRDDVAVLNAADPICAGFQHDTLARPVWFNGDGGERCFYADDRSLIERSPAGAAPFLAIAEIPLRGAHNVENVLAAAAVAAASGISLETFAGAVRTFRPVAHRLELVTMDGGVAYYNDSIATSPERTLAGMRSFDEPLVLLLGGREKNLPLAELAAAARARARAVICFGEAGPALAGALTQHADEDGAGIDVVLVDTLEQAVLAARARAVAGDVVLLSPACTSFDAYPNFERRGEEFRRIVLDQPAARASAPRAHSREAGAPSQQ